jgi:malate dehydrogenase (oxaloacetate-decarboxylating)(NADP+)
LIAHYPINIPVKDLRKEAEMTNKKAQFSDKEALIFHSKGRPGKIEINPPKPMATQRDLSLAYSPGVAVPVLAIAKGS